MSASSTKILVKVGKQSKIKFRGAQAFRAVTLDELTTLTKLNPDASIAVIENIKQSDDGKLKEFIKEFEAANENNKVFFFVPDNDDATCGVADELAYDICLTIADLYRAIKIHCGIVVDTDLSLSAEINGTSGNDDIFDESFGDALEAINNPSANTIVNELPSIETKDDFEDFDSSMIEEDDSDKKQDSSSDTASEPSVTAEGVSADNSRIEKELREKLAKADSDIADLKNQIQAEFDKNKKLHGLVTAVENERNAFQEKLKLYGNVEILEEPISLIEYKKLQDTIEELSKQNTNSQVDTQKVEELEKALKDASDSKDEVQRQLDEYKERLRESGSKLSAANDKIDEYVKEIRSLKEQVSTFESNAGDSAAKAAALDAANAKISDAANRIDSLSSELRETKGNLDRAHADIKKLLDEKDNILAQIESEVNARLFLIDALTLAAENAQEAEITLKKNSEEIESLKTRIRLFESADKQAKEKIMQLEAQIAELGEASTVIENLKSEKASIEQTLSIREGTISQLNAQLTENIKKKAELEMKVADADRRVELAHSFSKDELEKAKRDVTEWQTKFEVIQSQLSAKEEQYNSLVNSVGMNENGVSSILENTKSIEEMNNTLKMQVMTLKKELDTVTKDRDTAQQTAKALEESNKNMRASMKSMSELVGNTGSGTRAATVHPIKYNSRGMIIPIFGSGSYGITTTAMSLANKLAGQARVLYIDLDIVAPKADSWFRINPIVKNIPGIDTSYKSTGIGILIDKPFQFFASNADNIISRTAIQTKSGSVDYISGIYAKFDNNKIASANFEALLNYCGNMYTYIIVDFGRLGSSDLNDQIIKAFSDIAYKNIVVTTSDKFEIRNFRLKLGDAKISLNNIFWLINMCTTTKLDDMAKKAITPAQYSLMPFSPELYGKRLNFINDSFTRDKLSVFIENALFQR